MPLYLYECEKCGTKLETVCGMAGIVEFCCGKVMKKMPTAPAIIKVRGLSSPTRRWADKYKPGDPQPSMGSIHGEKY